MDIIVTDERSTEPEQERRRDKLCCRKPSALSLIQNLLIVQHGTDQTQVTQHADLCLRTFIRNTTAARLTARRLT